MQSSVLSKCTAIALVSLLAVMPVWAQNATPIQLHLMNSDGARVIAGTRTTQGIAIQVSDIDGKPVPDAAVAFRFPESGPTAMFGDGTRSAVAYTDATGSARVSGFQWGSGIGPLALRVTASKGDAHAGLLVEQTVMSGSASDAALVHETSIPAGEAGAVLPSPSPSSPANTALAADHVTADRVTTEPVAVASVDVDRPVPGTLASRLNLAPAISITSTGSSPKDFDYHPGFNKKKWILLGIAAGAGVGIALALMSGKSAATPGSGLSVGAPTISIGHP